MRRVFGGSTRRTQPNAPGPTIPPPCIDIVGQIAAVRAALPKVEEAVPRPRRPLRRGRDRVNKGNQRREIAGLMDVFGRADR